MGSSAAASSAAAPAAAPQVKAPVFGRMAAEVHGKAVPPAAAAEDDPEQALVEWRQRWSEQRAPAHQDQPQPNQR